MDPGSAAHRFTLPRVSKDEAPLSDASASWFETREDALSSP
jgi:hypothetical protein